MTAPKPDDAVPDFALFRGYFLASLEDEVWIECRSCGESIYVWPADTLLTDCNLPDELHDAYVSVLEHNEQHGAEPDVKETP